jgi:hypothetical protein
MARVFDLFITFLLIFGFVFAGMMGLFLLNIFKTNVFGSDADTVSLINALETNVKRIDYVMVFFFFLVGTLNFLGGFFMKDNPVFFFLELFAYLLGIIFAVMIQNVMTIFLTNSNPITAYLSNFPFTQIILSNLVIIYVGLSSFYLIGRYAKKNFFITG